MTDRTHYCAGCKERQDYIEKLEADNARLNDALRQAVIDAAEWARKAGEAQGKLEISEAAGILDGWMRDCERLRADNVRLRAALEGVLTGSTHIECGERVIYAGAVNAVRAALGETFEDLGQAFEAVWDANRDKLYEGDTK